MFDDVGAAAESPGHVDALLALASATLRRDDATLIESRACCAEHLLALVAAVPDPALHARIRLLFLLAWLRLGADAERGPESVSVTPSLPPGIDLPNAVDVAAIADPVLREQAREEIERHRAEAELWNARQAAIAHLARLGSLARIARPDFRDGDDQARAFSAAMALAPGLPPAMRSQLAGEAD